MNTRFNPTVNGPLHIGHIYMALVNEHEARASGGKFFVRFDDNQPHWRWVLTQGQIDVNRCQIKADLEYCGLKPDGYQSQIEMEDAAQQLYELLDRLACPRIAASPVFFHGELPTLISTTASPYPYAPDLTLEKVLMDFMTGVNLLIRGEDLLDEYSLYTYFAKMLTVPNPRHIYLPRLRAVDGGDVQPDISKTMSNYKIKDLKRDGFSPERILHIIRRSCLKDPEGPFSIENIKPNPRIEESEAIPLRPRDGHIVDGGSRSGDLPDHQPGLLVDR